MLLEPCHKLGELLMIENIDEIRCRDARLVQIAPGIRQGADRQIRGFIIEASEKGIGGLRAQAEFLQRSSEESLAGSR